MADKELGIAVSARNLSLAEEAGADLIVLCNGCFEALVEADAVLRHDEAVRSNVTQVLAAIGRRYEGKIKIKHFIEFLHEDVGIDGIRKALKTPMEAAVACHYGCHLFRETASADTLRKPRMMRDLVEASGARLVDSGLEQLCCGFPIAQFDKAVAVKERLLPKVNALSKTAAEAVIFCCPACLNQFETGQGDFGEEHGTAVAEPKLDGTAPGVETLAHAREPRGSFPGQKILVSEANRTILSQP